MMRSAYRSLAGYLIALRCCACAPDIVGCLVGTSRPIHIECHKHNWIWPAERRQVTSVAPGVTCSPVAFQLCGKEPQLESHNAATTDCRAATMRTNKRYWPCFQFHFVNFCRWLYAGVCVLVQVLSFLPLSRSSLNTVSHTHFLSHVAL